MPGARCLWCTDPPREEVAVLRWRGDDKERLTIALCGKHLERLSKAGERGRESKASHGEHLPFSPIRLFVESSFRDFIGFEGRVPRQQFGSIDWNPKFSFGRK